MGSLLFKFLFLQRGTRAKPAVVQMLPSGLKGRRYQHALTMNLLTDRTKVHPGSVLFSFCLLILGPVHTTPAGGAASENAARLRSPRIFAAARRDGANFPQLFVHRCSDTPGIRHSSFLDLSKIGSRRRPPG